MFFAYEQICPDLKEFNICKRSHEDSLREIINIKNRKKTSDKQKANEILTELKNIGEDEDLRNYLKKLLKYWPEPPTIGEMEKA